MLCIETTIDIFFNKLKKNSFKKLIFNESLCGQKNFGTLSAFGPMSGGSLLL